MPKRKRYWFHKRTYKDAPSHLADMAMTKEVAWAEGYNTAVQNYIDDQREAFRKEGLDVDGSWVSRD